MIQHVWSLVCKESKIEVDSNNISVIDIYESLQFGIGVDKETYKSDEQLVVPFNFEVVSLFYRDTKVGDYSLGITIEVIDPESKKLGEVSTKLEFKDGMNRMRNRVKFNSIAITKSGTYVFKVYSQKERETKKHSVAVIPIDVQVTISNEADLFKSTQ